MKVFFSIITVKSRWCIGRSTGLISGGKTLVSEIDFLYVMYGILRNSTLSETNKYSNCLRKNLIPGVKHTSFLLL